MASITCAALRALKFYKHVVQAVEKFIIRSPPVLKIPGLYVIDAIVRQSKYCYMEKDVYGPRFMRNLVNIFLSLLQCEEKDRIMLQRVLHLWQRSSVFPEVIIHAIQSIIENPENDDTIQKGEYFRGCVFLLCYSALDRIQRLAQRGRNRFINNPISAHCINFKNSDFSRNTT